MTDYQPTNTLFIVEFTVSYGTFSTHCKFSQTFETYGDALTFVKKDALSAWEGINTNLSALRIVEYSRVTAETFSNETLDAVSQTANDEAAFTVRDDTDAEDEAISKSRADAALRDEINGGFLLIPPLSNYCDVCGDRAGGASHRCDEHPVDAPYGSAIDFPDQFAGR